MMTESIAFHATSCQMMSTVTIIAESDRHKENSRQDPARKINMLETALNSRGSMFSLDNMPQVRQSVAK